MPRTNGFFSSNIVRTTENNNMNNSANVFGVLFISPHAEDAIELAGMLHPLPEVVFEHVPTFQQARSQFNHEKHRVILTEANLPDGSWRDVLSLAQQTWPPPPVLVTDLHATDQLWAEVLNLGGHDLVVQPFAQVEVLRIFRNTYNRLESRLFAVDWA